MAGARHESYLCGNILTQEFVVIGESMGGWREHFIRGACYEVGWWMSELKFFRVVGGVWAREEDMKWTLEKGLVL